MRSLDIFFGDVNDDELPKPKKAKANPAEGVEAQEQCGAVKRAVAGTHPEAISSRIFGGAERWYLESKMASFHWRMSIRVHPNSSFNA